jgi:hypothetical protein
MLGRPYELKDLSGKDRDWAQDLLDSKPIPLADLLADLFKAAEKDQTARVSFIFQKFQIPVPSLQQALVIAAENNAVKTLEHVFTAFNPSWFAPKETTAETFTHKLYAASAKNNAENVKSVAAAKTWDLIDEWNFATDEPQVSPAEVAVIAIQCGHHKALEEIFSNTNPQQSEILLSALKQAAQQDSETLENVLQWLNKFTVIQPALDSALTAAASKGLQDNVLELLNQGAEINNNNGAPLKAAVENNQDEMVTFLIENNADIITYGPAIIEELRQIKANTPMIKLLSRHLDEQIDKQALDKQENERFSIPSPSMLAETLFFPDGNKLTIIFDFAARQKYLIAWNDKDTDNDRIGVFAQNFEQDETHTAIEQAEKKYAELTKQPAPEAPLRPKKHPLQKDK